MSSMQNRVARFLKQEKAKNPKGYKKLVFPKNKTKFFFDKMNGKQFHAKYSACDDFTVRLQIRKNKSVSWEYVGMMLQKEFWLRIFITPGVTSTNETQLVSSYRIKTGDHSVCVKRSREYKKALKKYQETGIETVFSWPKKCLVKRKKHG